MAVAVDIRLVRLSRADEVIPWARQLVHDLERQVADLADMLNGLMVGSGGGPTIQDLSGSTGTAHTLSAVPTRLLLFLNALYLRDVTSIAVPNAAQYTRIGANVTTGHSVLSGEDFVAVFWT